MDLDNCPGIFIPCENLDVLQSLVFELFKKGILNDDVAFKLTNVPEDIYDVLNDPAYFEMVEVCGIRGIKGEIEKRTDDLL